MAGLKKRNNTWFASYYVNGKRVIKTTKIEVSPSAILPGKTKVKMADREGFEPSVPVCGTHTFQACSFDHSDTCPLEIVLDRKAGAE